LGAGERFDVRVWHEEQPPDRGIAWAEIPWHEIDLAEFQPGRYHWYIVVIREDEGKIEDLSEHSGRRSFTLGGN
jgi:hypothetical protein